MAGRFLGHAGTSAAPERLRLGIQKLGLTYLKLGQFFALRFDILPPAIYRELEKLFDNVPPEPFYSIEALVEDELGGSIRQLFSSFNEKPVAAASIAQVHEAWTWQGDHVAVKVQRPGIDTLFASDVRNIRRVAAICDAFGLLGALSAKEAIDEFARWTEREFDFITEGRTAERVRQTALPFEQIPAVYWDLTTGKVLTMEYIEGYNLASLIKLQDEKGWDTVWQSLPNLNISELLHRAATASLHQIFEIGFFHGDPHPGNLIICADNTVAFVDFGIFGELNSFQRELLITFMENLSLGLIEPSFRAYAALADPTEQSDIEAFSEEGKEILARWYSTALDPSLPASERHFAKYAGEMTEAVRKNRLHLTFETLLFWRALNTLNATALRVAPEFDLLTELRRFFEESRGGPARRVQTVLHDGGWRDSVAELASRGQTGRPEISAGALASAAVPACRDRARADRQRDMRTARQMSLILVGLSLLILAKASTFDAAFRELSAAAGVLMVLLIFLTGRGPALRQVAGRRRARGPRGAKSVPGPDAEMGEQW